MILSDYDFAVAVYWRKVNYGFVMPKRDGVDASLKHDYLNAGRIAFFPGNYEICVAGSRFEIGLFQYSRFTSPNFVGFPQ